MSMADNWQDTTSQQIKLIADGLNELLTSGINLLHTELGVDLGLKPELYPPWVILLAACIGLVLMVALWASACRGVFKKRPTITILDDSIEGTAAAPKLGVRNEEPKRKKRKTVEKKPQSNGRTIAETQQEEIKATEDVPHHQPQADVKPEKVSEVKKAKKKSKQAVKEGKGAAEGKEPEEGTWETKVSNKEKREQRRKDKTPGDGPGSPRGGDSTPSITPPELPKPAAVAAGTLKKKKGDSSRAKAEKDVVTTQVDSSKTTTASAASTDLAVKTPAHVICPDGEHSPANQSAEVGTPEPVSVWGQETEGSWTVVDAGMCFPGPAAGTAAAVAPTVTDVPWLGSPQVEDEWSGMNGESADPSSDWNAPSEAWVNHEEPPEAEVPEVKPPEAEVPEAEVPEAEAPSPPAQEELPPEPAKVSEEEKDKGESTAEGNGKSKKKKKKKKKQAEDGGGVDQDGEEPEREAEAGVMKQPAQETAPPAQPASAAAPPAAPPAAVEVHQPPPVFTQVPQTPAEAAAAQNNLPAPAHQTAEESQLSKPLKKKKARRET